MPLVWSYTVLECVQPGKGPSDLLYHSALHECDQHETESRYYLNTSAGIRQCIHKHNLLVQCYLTVADQWLPVHTYCLWPLINTRTKSMIPSQRTSICRVCLCSLVLNCWACWTGVNDSNTLAAISVTATIKPIALHYQYTTVIWTIYTFIALKDTDKKEFNVQNTIRVIFSKAKSK
jgi:hypothetical protein